MPDLVVGVGNSVEVLLGKGDGTFAASATYPVPVFGSVVVADLNGDGEVDVAVASYDGVSVLLNQGGGTFGAAVDYVVIVGQSPGSPFAVVAGDLDGDGSPELVVAGDNGVSVLRNHGDGTFAAPVTHAVPNSGYPGAVALGDLNGDGHADLAVASTAVVVLLNQGDGTFGAGVGYPPGANGLAMGDLDGDGQARPRRRERPGGRERAAEPGRRRLCGSVSYPVPMAAAVGLGDMDGDGGPTSSWPASDEGWRTA